MSGFREVKVWMLACESCRRTEGPTFSEYTPTLPQGWEYRTHHDCGMTGYSRRAAYCPDCIEREAHRA